MSAAKSPELRAREACRWIAGNLDAFDWLVGVILAEVDKGNPCFMRGDAFKLAREQKVRLSNVEQLCRDNSLWAIFTRYAGHEVPESGPYGAFQGCAHRNEAPLARIWREEVDADTVFRGASVVARGVGNVQSR